MKDLITWLLVIAGWTIVASATLRQARRSEARAELKAIEKHLRALEALFVEYFTSKDSKDPHRARQLRADVAELAGLIRRTDFDRGASNSLVMKLRQHATGGTFDSASRQKKSHNDSFFYEFSVTKQDLVSCLYQSFRAKHDRGLFGRKA